MPYRVFPYRGFESLPLRLTCQRHAPWLPHGRTLAAVPWSTRKLLPQPDPDNMTVLTDRLPNTPILPWSHYDSPWKSSDSAQDDGASEPTQAGDREASAADGNGDSR